MKLSRLSACLALCALTAACGTLDAAWDAVTARMPFVGNPTEENQNVTAAAADEAQGRSTRMAPSPAAPRATAVPAPAEEPDGIHVTPPDHQIHVLMAYFDFNTARISSDSHREIRAALARIPISDVEWVAISGHADRSGPEAYNVRLSRERAHRIRSEFLQAGLSEQIIEISSHGEVDPLVQTSDEVSEPLNRRVEIVIETKKPKADESD